ncbi:SMODS domain-containing nucleotidyltransferase [Candidatus Poriferisodalis sp.]|uniref:SMODS domain-containing nucleotidyltransferase n=1 Tax=Candidatus Poriferisodalis sp. TaxID=3101277 RepID=UPI003B51904A
MQHAEYFKDFLKDAVNIDDTRLAKLESRVNAVYKALKADEEIGSIIKGKSRQGSWAQRTIIRPKSGDEFDADFLLLMDEQAVWEPRSYLNEVYNALGRHPTYSKQEHGRKCRCVWLKYAPENGVGCHLDIVPLVTLAGGRRVIVNRDNNTWEPVFGSTNPQGFTDWMKRRDQLASGQFRRVVRLMKYLRNERGSFDGVKSVILTTVLGLQVTDASALAPGTYANIPTALVNIVEDLDRWLQAQPSKPWLANPAGDGTNFDHRWTDATYRNFRDRIHSIAGAMRAAYDEPNVSKSAKEWRDLFGDKFNPPAPSKPASKTSLVGLSAGAMASSRASRSGQAG